MGTTGTAAHREPWMRGCDLLALEVRDVCHVDPVATRAVVLQRETKRPVQFEITQAARDSLQVWIKRAGLEPEDFPYPSLGLDRAGWTLWCRR